MQNHRTTCNSQWIELFLDQKLSDEEQTAFESHLSNCDDCCRRLEAKSAREDIWSGVREFLRDQRLPPDGPQSGDSDCNGEDASSSQTTVLKLLAPTDDDRMLGRWGAYEVMGVVGTGGMGVVLKALDAALNRYVAIKVLAPHLGSSGAARRRFSREAQASAAVVHDNVIEIYGVAEAAGLPYLVMPYVRGPSLQRRLDDGGPMALAEILRVGMQAADGLAAAHSQGLVHRDVKPANILLADGIERVKLTDFGLARAADDASLTKTGVIAGTPQYMSPEQARGEPVDQRSDLFSLGSVLYAMCTGRAPFRAETSYGVLRRITDEEPRPIREINSEVPEWLCGIVSKLMAKRPEDRFQSAQEVAKLLEECLAHVQQPTVVPLPAGLPLRPTGAHKPRLFAGWSGRKRILATAIGLLFFAGLVLSFGILIHLKKDNKTTTLEVPEGSTAHFDAQGAVTLELPSSSAPAATDPKPDDRADEKATGTQEGRASRVPASSSPLDGRGDLGVALLGMFAMQATAPPDISGKWQGKDWGQITLKQTAPGEYTGTYTDTVAKEKGPGKIDLKWSRIERRYNGTWREGDDDRFGRLSVNLVGKEIRGALTIDEKSKINPATLRLAEVVWRRGGTTAGAAANPSVSSTGPTGQDARTAGQAAAGTGVSPAIERITVDSERAVIEGRASKNDKIVFVFGEKEAMSQTFPSSVHFKCTVGEGEADDERGPVARVTDTDGKEVPDMPAQILPVLEPVFVDPQADAFTVVGGSLHFRSGSTTRRPDGTVIVADCWANLGAPFYAQRVPFGVKLVPAARKSEKERTGATVTGRVLTEPGGTGMAGVTVGLRNRIGPSAWTQHAVTAADGTYTFHNVPPGESLQRNRNVAPNYYNYEAWIEAAPDRPPGVWSEAISVPVEQQDVRAHDLYLKYAQSISGTVRDADTGKPIAGAQMWFSSNEGGSAGGGEGPRSLKLGPKMKVTDAQGRYKLYVRPREITVRCDGTPGRYNRDDVHGRRTVVAEPQQETTVDFFCVSGAPLTGRVVNLDGTPAKDARVRVSVDWPVLVVANNGARGLGGSGLGGGSGADRRGGRGGRGGRGAGGGTEKWSVSFEANTDREGQFEGYMRQPNLPDGGGYLENVGYVSNIGPRYMLQTALPVSIKARAWLPDRSRGGTGEAVAHFGEPLARPLVVTLEKTGAAVVRVLFQDGRPVHDAEIRADGFFPGADSRLAGQQGKPVEYLGDGRYRIAGLTAGLDYRLRAFRRKLPTRTQTGKLGIKPGQTTDAGELRLEWEEGLAGDAQPRFRLENRTQVNLAFSPDGATLASISTPVSASDPDVDDVKLIDVATGKVMETRSIPAVCMAFFPKSDRLVLGCRDGTVVLTNEKKLTTWKSFPVGSSAAYPVAVSRNGAMIACDTGKPAVGCWDVMSGRQMHTLREKLYYGAGNADLLGQIAGFAFSPDNKLLVAADQKGNCVAWDLESEKQLGSYQGVASDRFPRVYTSYRVSICFCPDGKTAGIAFEGAEPLRFWDPRGGKPPVLVSLPDAIPPKPESTSAEDGPVKAPGRTVLSPDCKTAATVLYSGWVAVWDIPGRRVFQVLPTTNWEGNAGQFRGLAFSPDGRLLATGNSQGVEEVWEIDAAARDVKKSKAPAVALPDFLKTSEEQTVPVKNLAARGSPTKSNSAGAANRASVSHDGQGQSKVEFRVQYKGGPTGNVPTADSAQAAPARAAPAASR